MVWSSSVLVVFIQSTESWDRRFRRFRKSQQSSVLRSALDQIIAMALLSFSFQTADHGTSWPPLLRESIIKVNLICLYIFQFYIDTNSHAWETVQRGGRKSIRARGCRILLWNTATLTEHGCCTHRLSCSGSSCKICTQSNQNSSLEWGGTPETTLVAEKLLAVDCWGMKRHFWEYGS